MIDNIPILYGDNADCCACGACVNICKSEAISFAEDKDGFMYPLINTSKCVKCGQCVRVCDFHNREDYSLFKTPIAGYAAVCRNKNILKDSSSGGVFSAVAKYVLDQKGCVFGCIMTREYEVCHICANSMEEIAPLRRSKYIQSGTTGVYRMVKDSLKEGKCVLFVGTPCQVAALYKYLGDFGSNSLITIDLVCHGVANSKIFRGYIAFLEKKLNAKIVDYRFRSKKYGWDRQLYELDLSRNGKIRKGRCFFWGESVFHANYTKGNILRPSDFNCKYAIGKRVGDFTIGDLWGYDKTVSFNPNKGISCCLLNTEKAVRILSHLELNLQEIPVDFIVNGNVCLRHPSKKGKNYEHCMDYMRNGRYGELDDELRRSIGRRVRLRRLLKVVLPLQCYGSIKKYI